MRETRRRTILFQLEGNPMMHHRSNDCNKKQDLLKKIEDLEAELAYCRSQIEFPKGATSSKADNNDEDCVSIESGNDFENEVIQQRSTLKPTKTKNRMDVLSKVRNRLFIFRKFRHRYNKNANIKMERKRRDEEESMPLSSPTNTECMDNHNDFTSPRLVPSSRQIINDDSDLPNIPSDAEANHEVVDNLMVELRGEICRRANRPTPAENDPNMSTTKVIKPLMSRNDANNSLVIPTIPQNDPKLSLESIGHPPRTEQIKHETVDDEKTHNQEIHQPKKMDKSRAVKQTPESNRLGDILAGIKAGVELKPVPSRWKLVRQPSQLSFMAQLQKRKAECLQRSEEW